MTITSMPEVKLPSGAILKLGHTPFEESLALNEAILKELKGLSFTTKTEMGSLYKDLVCIGFSSELIKSALWKCFSRCTYNDIKITPDSFESIDAREDYTTVAMEVTKHNVLPFVKAHSVEFSQILEALKSSQESKPQTPPS